jgi:hypothetical protein
MSEMHFTFSKQQREEGSHVPDMIVMLSVNRDAHSLSNLKTRLILVSL